VRRLDRRFEILDSFKANEEKWENILSTEAINKIVCFKEILLSTKERYEESQLIILRDSRISNKKVREFKEAVLKNIETTPSVKNIFKFYSCVNLLDYDPKIKIKFGINTFFDKHAFLEDGLHQIYLGIEDGFEFGRSIVFGENKDIIDNIDKIVETSDLNTFLTGITDLKIISNYIVLSVNYAIDYIVDKFDNNTYIPNWYEDFNLYKNKFPKEIKGIINIKDGIIPVYEIFDQKSRNELILINIKSLGLINQYHQNKSQEIFNISVEDFFNGSQRESEILSNPPKWLKEVGEPQKQLDHIGERVIIEIYEQFNYTEPNEVDGIRVIISND
jgi:hypothetical protein